MMRSHLQARPSRRFTAWAGVVLAIGSGWLSAALPRGDLLVSLEAADFRTGAASWRQHHPDTGIPGGFIARGSPTREQVAGAPAVVFDGDGDYFIGPATTASLHGPAAPHSVALWVFQGNIREQESVVSWGRRSGPDGTFAGFRYGADPEFGAVSRWGSADTGFTTLPPPGRWHHLVFTYDGEHQRCYVDGQLDGAHRIGPVDTHNSLPILVGAELRGDMTVEGRLTHFSGALGRLQVHRGVLAPETVHEIHQRERPGFPGAGPARLPRPPLHRFSFGGAAGPAPDGTPVRDRRGGMQAVVRGNGAKFSGDGLVLPGGSSATAAYIDLPNGLVSSHAAVSIEFWATQAARGHWARLLSFGSGTAGEIGDPGGEFQGGEGIALFGNVGSAPVNRFTRSRGGYPNGGPDRDTADYPDSDYGTRFHHVIRYDPALQHWHWFRDAVLMESIPDTLGPTGIKDVNVWLGRSEFSDDGNLAGTYYELRIYNYALAEEAIRGNFLAGPGRLDLATPARSRSWAVSGAGTFQYRNPPGSDQWGTGTDGPHPDGPGAAAHLPGSPDGEQGITLDTPVSLGALEFGPDGPVRLLAGLNGSLTMDSGGTGPAAITLVPGSPPARMVLPLRLAADTELVILSGQGLGLGGPLGGAGILVKNGPGPLLAGNDLSGLSGGIRVLNGDFVLAGAHSAEPGLPAAEIVHPGRLVIDRPEATSIAPATTGSGRFIHRGEGPLTLGPASSLGGSGIVQTLPGAGLLRQLGAIDGAEALFIDSEAILAGGSVTHLSGWLAIGQRSAGTLRVRDNAELVISGAGHLNVGDVGAGHSAMFLENGTVRFKELHVGKNPRNSGVLIQTGGLLAKMTGGDESRVGGSSPGSHRCFGAMVLEGGAFSSDWNLQIGAYGTGAMVIDGGVAAIGRFMAIGRFQDTQGNEGQGIVDLVSGRLAITGPQGLLNVGEEGYGVLNVRSSGVLECTNAIIIGAGTVERAGEGIVNLLDDGLLVTGSIAQFNKSAASGILNLDGGTLEAGRDDPNFLADLDAIWIRPGGARIDTNGFNAGVTQPLDTPAGSGVARIPVVEGGSGYLAAPVLRIRGGGGHSATAVAELRDGTVDRVVITNPGAGFLEPPTVEILGGGGGAGLVLAPPALAANRGGGLTKTGQGILSLQAAGQIPGPVAVTEGRLDINGDFSASSGPVTVDSTATLGGTGTVGGPVHVTGGGTLSPGASRGALRLRSDLVLEGTLAVGMDDQQANRITVDGHLSLRDARLVVNAPPAMAVREARVIATYASLEGRFGTDNRLPPGSRIDYHHNGRNEIALVPADPDADAP